MSKDDKGVTPGPWEAGTIAKRWEVVASNGDLVAVAYNGEADARLIAQAPETKERINTLEAEREKLLKVVGCAQKLMEIDSNATAPEWAKRGDEAAHALRNSLKELDEATRE